jgi:hypothetical protein
VLDYCVHEEIINLSLGESEIATVCDKYVIRLLRLNHPIYYFLQVVHLLFTIVVFIIFGFEINVIMVVLVESETFRPAVITAFLCHNNGKNIFFGSKVLFVSSPNLHLLFFLLEFNLLFSINSCEEHSIKSNVSC